MSLIYSYFYLLSPFGFSQYLLLPYEKGYLRMKHEGLSQCHIKRAISVSVKRSHPSIILKGPSKCHTKSEVSIAY